MGIRPPSALSPDTISCIFEIEATGLWLFLPGTNVAIFAFFVFKKNTLKMPSTLKHLL